MAPQTVVSKRAHVRQRRTGQRRERGKGLDSGPVVACRARPRAGRFRAQTQGCRHDTSARHAGKGVGAGSAASATALITPWLHRAGCESLPAAAAWKPSSGCCTPPLGARAS
eukprot:170550-Rhodomonas_salina.1